ncbi:hypothetical protein ACS0TY_010568 [Phlomoides rotata]
MRRMWLSVGELDGEIAVDSYDNSKGDLFIGDIRRIREDSGAVLRTCSIEDEFSSSRSSMSSWNTDDLELYQGVDYCDCRNGNVENERPGGLEEVSKLSPSVEQFVDRETQGNVNRSRAMNKSKSWWLSKLRSMTCMMSGNVKEDNMGSSGFSQAQGTRVRRVRVRHCRRRLKELSALFTGQDIKAHDGSIIAMKFSLDGQYLASAGEDKIVRVWQVVEDERLDTIDIPDADPSCVYFSVNQLSELGPLMVEKDKLNRSKSVRKTHESACIVFPSKVFRILEKPLHVFEGHHGEILDLSWSKDNCLLSSSVDKTVRLWRVGVDHCLKVFQHSDYVTCVQFNPVNDDYFISGSIDGKVRIWTISCCKVVDWAETRNIITAVSYRPDGQGGIVGSIAGTCHFFHITDNYVQLGDQMCITSKKKSPCKRITGFQFLPHDPIKVLVTSADSQVRIIDGANVIGKYKGNRNAGNQSCASFTSDGNHIVSASDDSNVYIWHYNEQGSKASRSFECFSSDASVAIPWPGLKTRGNSEVGTLKSSKHHKTSLPFSSSTCLSLGHDYFFESTKGSATWPEEKLPVSTPQATTSTLSKPQYKLFKNSYQRASDSHAWGLVIVTSGWDGRIRSFHNYGLPVSL